MEDAASEDVPYGSLEETPLSLDSRADLFDQVPQEGTEGTRNTNVGVKRGHHARL